MKSEKGVQFRSCPGCAREQCTWTITLEEQRRKVGHYMSKGVIKKVAGPLVIASGMRDANMFDVVRVSEQRLIGEIIEIHGDEASIQVYE